MLLFCLPLKQFQYLVNCDPLLYFLLLHQLVFCLGLSFTSLIVGITVELSAAWCGVSPVPSLHAEHLSFIFVVDTCCGYLLWLFAVVIFAVVTCSQSTPSGHLPSQLTPIPAALPHLLLHYFIVLISAQFYPWKQFNKSYYCKINIYFSTMIQQFGILVA